MKWNLFYSKAGVFVIAGLLVIAAAIFLFSYNSPRFQSLQKGQKEKSLKITELMGQGQLSSELPGTNPFEEAKTNPFKDIRTNPFDL